MIFPLQKVRETYRHTKMAYHIKLFATIKCLKSEILHSVSKVAPETIAAFIIDKAQHLQMMYHNVPTSITSQIREICIKDISFSPKTCKYNM